MVTLNSANSPLNQEWRIAVIDLGSNTCRLVLFLIHPQHSFRLIDQVSERLRVAEGMFATNELQPEPMERAVRLLNLFRELCEANSIDRVIATASSAVRDAKNRGEFLERVEQETGLSLRVLSGEEEAYYAYLGAVNSLSFTDGVVADLGGGSLELVRVRRHLPVGTASLPLGAVRLAAQFLHNDPPKPRQVKALTAFVDEELQRLNWPPLDDGEQLVCLGGTIRGLANIDQKKTDYPLNRLHGYVLSWRAVKRQAAELDKKQLKQRKKIPGLKAERADIIPAGALIIARLMKRLEARSLVVSGRGLREGLFYEEYLRRENQASAGSAAHLSIPVSVAGVSLFSHMRTLGVANIASIYSTDWAHSEKVCDLALMLFDQLHDLHGYGDYERELLGAAAILHDVGVAIDYYRHHHHSAYIIENADLLGFSHREVALIELLVRWHRRGNPDLAPFESILAKADLALVRKLSALLRLAEDLERSRAQVIEGIRCTVEGQTIRIRVQTRGAAEAELWAARRDVDIFESAYGVGLEIIPIPSKENQKLIERHSDVSLLQRAERLAAKFRRG